MEKISGRIERFSRGRISGFQPCCSILPNGRPCEYRIIEKEFLNLKEKAGLPNVVFHSLRHSSTTYKLKLNHGDLKATQGDTGHAEIDMITKVYEHILDEDRKINAAEVLKAHLCQPRFEKCETSTGDAAACSDWPHSVNRTTSAVPGACQYFGFDHSGKIGLLISESNAVILPC